MAEITVPPAPRPLDIVAPQPPSTMSFTSGQVQGLDATLVSLDGRMDILEGFGGSGVAPKLGHRHTQGLPSDAWVIQHDLGFNPAGIIVRDSGGNLISHGDPVYTDLNSMTLNWPYAFGGTADLT